MLIAIPSMGRAGKVKSTKILPTAVLYVPEGEAELYRRAGHRNVVAVPNEVRGITRTRNWILNNTAEAWVVMLDDDVKAAGFVDLEHQNAKHRKFGAAVWLREFEKLFEVAEDLRYRVWGVATQSSPWSVYPWKPFLFRSYVTASCMGIRNDMGIRFDEAFPVKEDYELGLRCVLEDGGIVAARHIYWENSHWTDEGGCKDYRTGEMEQDCIDRLVAKYGSLIRRVTKQGTDYSIELDF